ncbi:MAG: EamA family transporter [Anaerolineales bacterium]|nr:EamA family transporter [Anaerolineales bacterium]
MLAGAGSVIFGLLSAAVWGAGDFCGGLAARRAASTYAVVIGSQLVGILLVLGLALGLREPLPPAVSWLWGALAGWAGAIGLLALYRALASGRMGVAAPLSAVFAAALPVAAAALAQGLPSALTLAGFGLALTGVWLLSRPAGAVPFAWRDLGLPLLAGTGFGLFFVFIALAGQAATFWPLVASRSASLALMLAITAAARQAPLPERPAWPLAALSGLLDACGNACFALAAQAGRLDVAAVLSSLYPASTVLLAVLVLKERFTRLQVAGIAAALAAIVLIAW